jgi:hypothetical protein
MKIISASPTTGYRVRLAFDDGVAGEVDLADYAGVGVFQAWRKPGVFKKLTVTKTGALAWPGDLDLCADALYLRVTGKRPEELFPALRKAG